MSKRPHKGLTLRKNFVWAFAGNAAYTGAMAVMLMSMTKLLPAEEVGLFFLATAIITPIQMFTNLQLRAVEGSDAKKEYLFGEYLALRIITVFVLVAVSVAISVLIRKGTHMILVVSAVVLYKCADCYADITYGLLQKYERLDKVALSRMLRASIGVGVFVAIMWATRNIALSFLAIAATWLALFLLVDIRFVRAYENPTPVFRMGRLARLAVLSMPLGLTMAITTLNTRLPQYFIEKYSPTSAQLGYFGSLAYVVVALRLAVSSLGQSAMPRLSKYYIGNLRAYFRLLGKMVLVGAGIGLLGVLGGALFGKKLLTLAYTSEYAQHNTVFIWLLVSGAVGYVGTMLCVGLTAARLFKVQVPLIATVTLVTLFASWVLIPRHGLVGAAWVMLAGSLTTAVGALAVILINAVTHANRHRKA